MLFDHTNDQEQFGNAFLRAIAACTSASMAKPEPDRNKVDFVFSKDYKNEEGRRTLAGRVETQIKTFKYPDRPADVEFSYSVDSDLYNWLRTTLIIIPRYLIVITLPDQHHELLAQDRIHTRLHHGAFYKNLYGMEPISSASLTLKISYDNLLTPESLNSLLDASTRQLL